MWLIRSAVIFCLWLQFSVTIKEIFSSVRQWVRMMKKPVCLLYKSIAYVCVLYQHRNWQLFRQIHGIWHAGKQKFCRKKLFDITDSQLYLQKCLCTHSLLICEEYLPSVCYEVCSCHSLLREMKLNLKCIFLRVHHSLICGSLIFFKFFLRNRPPLKQWNIQSDL